MDGWKDFVYVSMVKFKVDTFLA